MRVRVIAALLVVAAVSSVLAFQASTQKSAPPTTKPADAPLADVKFMVRGYCYAGSKMKDKRALGGFGTSDNFPQEIDAQVPKDKTGVYLHTDLDTPILFRNHYRGMRLLLVNATDNDLWLPASDSRLSIVQEALDKDGTWKPIEYLPSSWCGNSYHRVGVAAHEYWAFPAARYDGPVKTKLRFKLLARPNDKHQELVSNEFDGGINPEQFTQKQGHAPTNIMDPYLE